MCSRLHLLIVFFVLASPMPALAQLDPLLFLKTTKPNVLLLVDTGERMQRDTDSNYYDPFIYTKTGATWESALGLTALNTNLHYRRKFLNMTYVDSGGNKAEVSTIQGVGDLDPGYAQFEAKARLSLVRAALTQVVEENQNVARFGLIKMRQLNPAIGTQGNFSPVLSHDSLQSSGTEGGSHWKLTRPTVDVDNGSLAGIQAALVGSDGANANTAVLDILAKSVQTAGALIPAGNDESNAVDEPLQYMLDDARAEALRLINLDLVQNQCRNTIVVLVTGGKEGTTASSNDPIGAASNFVALSGRRVPIYVVGVAPPAADSAQLSGIAAASGGQYFEVTKAMIDQTSVGQTVPDLVRAVNVAVQHTFASEEDFDAAPTAQTPHGPETEFQVTSPIVGTVNLEGAKDIAGVTLPDTDIKAPSGAALPQRSNVMVTTALALPGFEAKLRAFRVFKPVADSTKLTGYRFVSDGTRLWVASVPTAASRNIYTVLPDGTLTEFSSTNAAVLAPYLNTSDATGLIDFVRSQPLGAVVGSTPAIMDPPSIDPPPDDDYPPFIDANKDRRGLVWVGANDGMLHALDARRGVEVWAFIPFNLLPKLRALRYGQAVGIFDYFVDSSPKIADVKVGDEWRTYLVFGEGPGGTFYQTLDVTMDTKSPVVSPTDDTLASVLSYFAAPSPIQFKWSFPSYSHFDHTLAPYGDIAAEAPTVSKTVGETWSDPAIGQVQDTDGKFTVLTGSGFLAYSKQQQSNRGGTVAGTTFYLLDAADGTVFDSRSVGSDDAAETVDTCSAANDCTKLKNALQADPVATGPPDSRYVSKAYIGDLDGRVWRFDLATSTVTGKPAFTADPLKLFDNTAAHPLFSSMATVNVGTTQQYIFYGTGSDLLPSSGVSQQYKLVGLLDQGASATQKFSVLLTKTDNSGDDEKVTAFPAVAGDIVFFSTTSFKPTTPCTAPNANLYALTFIGGPAYDNTGDNKITAADTPKVKTITGARATAPFITDQHLVFGAGSKVELFGDPQDFNNGVGQAGVRILSWREVR